MADQDVRHVDMVTDVISNNCCDLIVISDKSARRYVLQQDVTLPGINWHDSKKKFGSGLTQN